MLIKEYRITLPVTVEEYQIGQLYSVAEASKNETGGGEGVEVIKNEPFSNFPLLAGKFSKGQYTYKIYHFASKVPSVVRYLVPKGSLEIHEEAWNAYPYCKTIITLIEIAHFGQDCVRLTIKHTSIENKLFKNPDYMKKNFFICIETMHCADNGHQENVHQLPNEKLKHRDVVVIDIANSPINSKDYKESEDPMKFKSLKTGRGPLIGSWRNTVSPIMTCYKLVTAEFKWFGLQNKIEHFIQKTERRIFLNFHRQVFCWIDHWHGMTLQEIRDIEDRTKKELDQLRKQGSVRGTRSLEND